MNSLSLDQLKALIRSEAVRRVVLVGSDRGFHVEVNDTFVLVTQRKAARFFPRADTCFGWLKALGVKRIHGVDLNHWESK